MNFGSDNQSGVSPEVLQGLITASSGNAASYAGDDWTRAAVQKLSDVFETELDAFFVPTGTAANCLALSAMVAPWHSVLCHSQAHIAVDELSGPELFTAGARLVLMGADGGKLSTEILESTLSRLPSDRPHNQIPGALSLTQCSESGMVYSVVEVTALSSVAHKAGMHVHMDGARFANALVTLGCSPADVTWRAGVDVLCLGASKNGALALETVIFFNRSLAQDFDLRRKRSGHLVSKGRLFGAQMCAWLQDGHWLTLASKANAAASQLKGVLTKYPGIQIAWPVEANEIFAVVPNALFDFLKTKGVRLSDWYPNSMPKSLVIEHDHMPVRFVTSFSTQSSEIENVDLLFQAFFGV